MPTRAEQATSRAEHRLNSDAIKHKRQYRTQGGQRRVVVLHPRSAGGCCLGSGGRRSAWSVVRRPSDASADPTDTRRPEGKGIVYVRPPDCRAAPGCRPVAGGMDSGLSGTHDDGPPSVPSRPGGRRGFGDALREPADRPTQPCLRLRRPVGQRPLGVPADQGRDLVGEVRRRGALGAPAADRTEPWRLILPLLTSTQPIERPPLRRGGSGAGAFAAATRAGDLPAAAGRFVTVCAGINRPALICAGRAARIGPRG